MPCSPSLVLSRCRATTARRRAESRPGIPPCGSSSSSPGRQISEQVLGHDLLGDRAEMVGCRWETITNSTPSRIASVRNRQLGHGIGRAAGEGRQAVARRDVWIDVDRRAAIVHFRVALRLSLTRIFSFFASSSWQVLHRRHRAQRNWNDLRRRATSVSCARRNVPYQ